MMYGPRDFSRDGISPTITKRDGSLYTVNRRVLSVVDVDMMNRMYPFTWNNVLGGGYKDLDVGANGSTYVIGNTPTPGGYTIYELRYGLFWTRFSLDGGAVSIAVSPRGVPWVVNSNGNIFRRNSRGTGWETLSGRAREIDIGADGSVYIIGAALSASGGGNEIWKWNGTGWTRLNGGAVKIAVSPSGKPWIIDNAGNIFQRNYSDTGWNRLPVFDTGIDFVPGRAKEIDIGADGSVFIISTLPVAGGYKCYKWNGNVWSTTAWYPTNGGAIKITVAPRGIPWMINSAEALYKRVL